VDETGRLAAIFCARGASVAGRFSCGEQTVRTLLVLSAIVLLAGLARAADDPKEPAVPAGDAPKLWLGSAKKVDGKVVIQLSRPEERAAGPVLMREGVTILPTGKVTVWAEAPKLTLGKTARAFRTTGEPADDAAVEKALAKARGVAVFIRRDALNAAKPDPFYLQLLNADAIVIVADYETLYPSVP
jgi:hypothetical protein